MCPTFIEFRDGESLRGEEWGWSSGIGDGDGVVNSWTMRWDVPGGHAAEDVSIRFKSGGHEGLVSGVRAAREFEVGKSRGEAVVAFGVSFECWWLDG